ncbi:MAG: LuxR family transcriptional regulator [Ectothiorhodospiraceae bacterium]|nr:LuxR family transcriptional regulator [Ectothiorhodospiraceae bacterium]
MSLAAHAFPQSRQDIEKLIEGVYVAAAQPEHWQQVLHDLVNITQSRSARMLILDETASEVLASVKVNTDDSAHQRYVDYYVNTCPWRTELGQKQAGRLYSTYLHFSCDQRRFYRTEFFNDWARELDIHHGVCGTIDQAGGQTVQLLIQRTGGHGHYSASETDAINTLIPHLRRALFINRAIATERAQRHAMAAATQQYRLPYFLLNAQGQICHTSPDAETLVRRGVLPPPRNGFVRCETDTDTQRLRQLTLRCLTTATGHGESAGGDMVARRGDGSGLRLLVTPIHPDLGASIGQPAPRAFAAVFIHSPGITPEINQAMLVRLYGFTDAEARVAAAVARGQSLEATAEVLQVSVHTVRTQLKAAMRKTGTRRQTALAREILLSPACRPGEQTTPAPTSPQGRATQPSDLDQWRRGDH